MGFLANIFSGPPKPPSPERVSDEQIRANRETQAMNLTAARGNQTGPFSSTTFNPTGRKDEYGNEYFDVNQQLTPERQALLNLLQGSATNQANLINANYGDELMDFQEAIGDETSGMLKRHTDYLDPYYTKQINDLDNTLRNQGLYPGTPAYDNAMMKVRQEQNASIGAFLNSAQPIMFDQAMKEHVLPFDIMKNMIANANSITTSPQLSVPTSNMTPPNMAGISQDSYLNQVSQYNAPWQAIGSLAGTVLGGAPGTLAGGIGGGLMQFMGLK